MGWISCQTRHHINMIRLRNKFINMEESRIPKRVFNLDYQVCKNWSLELKDILYSAGLNQIYDNKIICNIDGAKCICVNLWNADWKISLPTKPKLRTYVKFKENIETESYIKYCMLRRRRSLLAQLRLGILPLHLETGRFRNKKVEGKICLICNLQYVENEEHFIYVCTTYSQLRNNLYLTVENAECHGWSNENKLVHLVKHKWK